MSALQTLKSLIKNTGPVPAVRVSSAQSGVCHYPYRDAVRYEVRLRKDGEVTYAALERAATTRRSERLAIRDARELAAREGRIYHQAVPGQVGEGEARIILTLIAEMVAVPQTEAA
jgi:hypothetical protein